MEIQIEKNKKTRKYKTIKTWSDVTLEKWLKLISIKTKSKSKEAKKTIAALSDIPQKLIDELSIQDVALLLDKLAVMQNSKDTVLKKMITVEGVEYGFHPSLDSITLGEYADIETFIKNGIENNLANIMAVLYRPVKEKKNQIYTIEAYDGNIEIRAEVFKKMAAEQVESALVFFWLLGKELSVILPSFLMERLMTIK
jgi:hypothetical protein